MAITLFKTTSWNTAGTQEGDFGSQKTVTLTGAAVGDLIVVYAMAEGYTFTGGTRFVETTSGSTSAWTENADPAVTLNNDTDILCAWATVTTAGSVTVMAVVRCLNTNEMGVGAFLVPAAEWTGTPVGTPFVADADGQISVTVGATSTVFFGVADWSATALGTANTPSGAVLDDTFTGSGTYSGALRHWTGQTAGTRAYGISGKSGLDASGIVLVVPSPSGGVTRTVNDSAGATDSVSLVFNRAITIADTAGASDAATVARSFSVNISDSAGASDTALTGQDRVVTVADTAGATDAVDVNIVTPPPVTTYSFWPTLPPGIVAASDTSDVILGTEFYVTADCYLNSIRYLHYSSVTTPSECALFSTTDGVTGTNLTGWLTMPVGVGGEWCVQDLPVPRHLYPGTRYVVAIRHPMGQYPAMSDYFVGTGSAIVNGPLVVPTAGDALANHQGRFTYTSHAFPDSSFANTSYFADVLVTLTTTQMSTDIADVAGATDTITISRTTAGTITDVAGATDTVTVARSFSVNISDSAGATDISGPQTIEVVQEQFDNAGATDQITVQKTMVRSQADVAAASDSISVVVNRSVAVPGDTAAASDSISVVINRVITIADSAGATDALVHDSPASGIGLFHGTTPIARVKINGNDVVRIYRGETLLVQF